MESHQTAVEKELSRSIADTPNRWAPERQARGAPSLNFDEVRGERELLAIRSFPAGPYCHPRAVPVRRPGVCYVHQNGYDNMSILTHYESVTYGPLPSAAARKSTTSSKLDK